MNTEVLFFFLCSYNCNGTCYQDIRDGGHFPNCDGGGLTSDFN